MAALPSSPGGAQEMDGPEQPSSQGVFSRGPRMAAAAKWLRHQRFITAAPRRRAAVHETRPQTGEQLLPRQRLQRYGRTLTFT